MGVFDVLKETASRYLEDKTANNTLYSRKRSPDELLRLHYGLPEPETLMARCACTIRVYPLGVHALHQRDTHPDQRTSTQFDYQYDVPFEEVFEGTISLSESFVMFSCSGEERMLTFTLPLCTIRRVERLPSSSDVFALKMTLYQDLQLVLHFDSSYSRSQQFCEMLGANLKAQVPLAKQLRQISSSFYSEYFVESTARRKKGESKASVQSEVAVPSGGLGRDFGYPGDAKATRDRSKMRLWLEYFGTHGRNIGMVRQQQFFKLVRVGLPNALRGEIWELCCGSVHLRMKQQKLYSSLLEQHENERSQATDEIDKDLKRSLPEFPAYQNEEGIAKLRRVLVAYSWMVPELGYCQAMNIVTAALLIFQTEAQAFWTLHVLVNRVLPGYYSRTMYGMLLDQKVLEHLLQKTMPILYAHLQKLDVPLSVVSLPWFLSLFANTMPLPFAFRIFDILMLEGSRALFQVSLGVLRVNGEALLQAEDNTAVLEILKRYFDSLGDMTRTASSKQITKFQELLVTAFKEFSIVTNESIHELRATHESTVLNDIEAYAKRTQLRNIAKPRNLGLEEMGVVYDTFYVALQATRPGLGGNTGELTYYQFVTFLSQLVDWVHPTVTDRETAESHPLIHKLFNDWDSKQSQSLSLADCVSGLSRLVEKDMMESINYVYKLYNGNILGLADAMLLMMRPFSEVHDGAIVLDTDSSRKFASMAPFPDDETRKEVLEKLQQQQSAQYLGAVSEFIQRAYEVTGLKVEAKMDATGRKASIKQAPSLIDIEGSNDAVPKTDEQSHEGISLPHFRMVILANETMELFFSTSLQSTVHLTEHGTGVLSGSGFGSRALKSVMDNVVNQGLNIADGLWRSGTVSTTKGDDVSDDVDAVNASDRALLDI